MDRVVHYFKNPGKENTQKCLEIAYFLALEGYKDFIVATTTGETAVRLANHFKDRELKDINLVAVTHSYGYKDPNTFELTDENKETLINLGVKIHTATMLTHSLETALSSEFYGVYPTILIAQTLRRMGQGVKVCCEIVMEACDGGLIQEMKEVVAIAGTGYGADTVCIIRSAASKRFLNLKVLEILAKPRE